MSDTTGEMPPALDRPSVVQIGTPDVRWYEHIETALITGQSDNGYHARLAINDGNGTRDTAWSKPFPTLEAAERHGIDLSDKEAADRHAILKDGELREVQQEAADMRAQALVAYEQARSPAERSELRSQAAELTVLMDAIQDAMAGSDRVSLGQVSTAAIEPLIERIEAIGIMVEVEAPTIAQEENQHQQEVER